MTLKLQVLEQLLIPGVVVVSAILVGFFLRAVVLASLLRVARKTSWRFGDIVIAALRNSIVLWSLALGLYVIVETQGLQKTTEEWVSKALGVIVIFSVTVVASYIGTEIIEYYKSRITGLASATSLLKNIVRFTVYSVGVLIILDDLRISIAPLLTALGVGGLAIGLGLQETLSNFFAGLQILAAKQIQIGNYIKLSTGEEGYVEDLNWRAIIICSLYGNHMIVPNKSLANLTITNYERPTPDVAVPVEMGVDYASDLERVERVTVEVAKEVQKTVPGAVRDYQPSIRFGKFGDSAIYFSVNLRGERFVDQYLLKHEFIKRVKDRFDLEGIVIPFPVRTLHLNK